MEDNDFRNLWNEHSSKLQTNLEVNLNSLKNANYKKTRLKLNRLVFRRSAETLCFLVILIFLLIFNIRNFPVPQYLISGAILGIFSVIGAIGNIQQIVLIIRLDYSRPVTDFLIKLEELKIYSLKTLRLLFLSLPCYLAYVIITFKVLYNYDIYGNANSNWVLWNLFLSILFVPFALYIYMKLKLNSKSNWVKKLIADNGGRQIDSAIQFIDEIVEYKGSDSSVIDKA
jgi:hypothetical protein